MLADGVDLVSTNTNVYKNGLAGRLPFAYSTTAAGNYLASEYNNVYRGKFFAGTKYLINSFKNKYKYLLPPGSDDCTM
jgi:hypothetical protein